MTGCITDVRVNGHWLPMMKSENVDSVIADVVQDQNLAAGCRSDACVSYSCQSPRVCVDHWRNATCE